MEALFYITGSLLIISIIMIIRLLKRNENLTELIIQQQEYIEKQDKYISNFSDTLKYCSDRLKEIDEKGIFQGDDEIGWFFNEVKGLKNILNNFIVDKNGEEEKSKKGV